MPTYSSTGGAIIPSSPVVYDSTNGKTQTPAPSTPAGTTNPGVQDVEQAAANARNQNAGKPGFDVFGNPVAKITTPGQPAKPVTAFSSDTAIQYAGDNTAKLQTLKNAGLSLGADGVARYSDGSFATAPSDAVQTENGTWQSGGVQYAIGPSTTMDPELKGFYDQINNMKATFDATSKAYLDNIHAQFDSLRQKQEDVNTRSSASLDQSLFMGGSSRYAQQSSTGQTAAMASYGLQQIADLNTKEQSAIIQAQQAQEAGDMKLMDASLQIAQKARDEKQAAAKTLSEKLTAQNDALVVKQKQNAIDTAVGTQMSNGITDPVAIVKTLADQGITTTAKDVSDSIANLNPDAKAVAQIQADAAKFGASPEVLKAIGSAKNLSAAYQAASGYLQDPTSTSGQYAAYLKQAQAAGQTPLSPTAWSNKQEYNEAYNKAAGDLAGKTAGGSSNSVSSTISSLTPQAQATLKTNGFTSYNSSTQDLATQLVNGQIAPGELSKRTTGSSSYNDILTAANKYSLATTGKSFDISKADRNYKFATNIQTQNTLNYLGSLVGSDDGSGKTSGGNLDQLVNLSDSLNGPHPSTTPGTYGVITKDGTRFPALNQVDQWAQLQTGNPEVAAYYATLLEVSDQIGKVLQGGGGGTSDAKLQQAQALFQKGFTPDQVKAVAGSMKELLGNRAASMVKDNPYLSDYANQFGVQTVNGVTTTNQKIMQDETVAEGKLTTFYNASPENQQLIDAIHQQFPDMSAQEVATKLGI